MKFSQKSRYAIKALIDIAINGKEGKVTVYSIAERNGISVKFLEQILAMLRKSGIVKSVHGTKGGYFLNKSPSEITVAEVLYAVEGDFTISEEDLSDESKLNSISEIVQKNLIDRLNKSIKNITEDITIAELEKEYANSVYGESAMYYI
ncbi:MAG: Rrf2 family transcriptional regulator [Firmicutes bacterium]|nr:Rrf2 family transcriptional regulator [Bacillota bacterium]